MLRSGPRSPALSARVEFMDFTFPSTGPEPCITLLSLGLLLDDVCFHFPSLVLEYVAVFVSLFLLLLSPVGEALFVVELFLPHPDL